MADLMQKTKKELIAMLQDKELAIQSLQNDQLVVLRSDYETVLDQAEQLKIVNKEISGQNEELAEAKDLVILELQRLRGELDKALSENHQIRDEAGQIRETCDTLTQQFDALKTEHAALEQRLQDGVRKSDVTYELFKSFVDADSRMTLLIDTAYVICYVNRSAAAHLLLPEPGAIIGCRLFDFFAYKEAVKIKKKIDAAFFSGEKEKIKDVVFRNSKGAEIRMDLKFARVRYRDKPSIKMTIK